MTALLIALLFAGPLTAERPMVTQPSWVQRPSGEDIGRVTPFLEQPPPEVHVLMVCRITAEGGLEACTIRSEDPPGLGYGPAALAVAQFFRMPPSMSWAARWRAGWCRSRSSGSPRRSRCPGPASARVRPHGALNVDCPPGDVASAQ
jgi:hypothetical protein